jgi:hypothetical protein
VFVDDDCGGGGCDGDGSSAGGGRAYDGSGAGGGGGGGGGGGSNTRGTFQSVEVSVLAEAATLFAISILTASTSASSLISRAL